MSSGLTKLPLLSEPELVNGIEPRFGQVMCQSSSGFHHMAYTEWGDPDAPRVALCVHGLTRQGRDFDALAVALAQYGYRVICPTWLDVDAAGGWPIRSTMASRNMPVT